MPIVGVVMEVILDIRFLIKEIATICIGNVGHALTIYNSYFLKKYTICLKVESKWFIFSLKGHALVDKNQCPKGLLLCSWALQSKKIFGG